MVHEAAVHMNAGEGAAAAEDTDGLAVVGIQLAVAYATCRRDVRVHGLGLDEAVGPEAEFALECFQEDLPVAARQLVAG